MASKEEEEDSNANASSSSSLDRRNFFSSAATKAASLSLLAVATVTTTTTSLDIVNAVDTTATTVTTGASSSSTSASSSYSKLYKPAPHSMDGKIVVITGGNAGLGLESTKRLAEAGATVIFTSRNDAKGQMALEDVNEYLRRQTAGDATFAGKAMVANLDLCDLDNVKSFKERLTNAIGKDAKIDVLMNNAGVMALPAKVLTKDGYETTFQTNHLGHFALTSTLLPMMVSQQDNGDGGGKVINVSSEGYQFASKGLELDNLNGEREYGPWSSYGLSKLENILFTNELQKRASKSEAYNTLRVYSLHPGAVQTDLARYLIGEEKFQSMKENGFDNWKDKFLMEGLAKFVKTVEEGASTQVYLAATLSSSNAVGGGASGGKFFSDGKVTKVNGYATDEGKGETLWDISEKLAGVKFEL